MGDEGKPPLIEDSLYIPKPEFKNRKFFLKESNSSLTCHLHVVEFQGTEWYEKILFRNYLRRHSATKEAYCKLKLELASEYKEKRSTYTMKKEPFIRETIRKAKQEEVI